MIWMFIALGYIACGFVASVLIARDEYKELVANPLAGLREYTNAYYRARDRKYGDEWTDEDETKRREKLRGMASKVGLFWGLFWPAALVMFLCSNGYDMLRNAVGRLAASPLERERNKELEYKKAQKIVDEYNAQQEKQWKDVLDG